MTEEVALAPEQALPKQLLATRCLSWEIFGFAKSMKREIKISFDLHNEILVIG